jgi:3-hydroxyisobutyrate dehydrogenase-like beta-hydroxyacid dehydrogenase
MRASAEKLGGHAALDWASPINYERSGQEPQGESFMTTRCGFIGLGIMGKALAGNLAPRGLPTVVYDLDAAALREVLKGGATEARSLREVAENADVIGICVPADTHVRAVLCAEGGVFAHAAAGSVVAIHSTVHPDTILEMAAAGASRGVSVLEVPVAGGPVRAAQGDAFYMVSGDEAALEKARPYLEAAAGKITFTGAYGNAAKLKLALNVLTNLSFAASLEGLLLARAMGLPQELYEEGGQATTMLSPLHLQYLSVYKLPDEAFRSNDLQSYLRGRMEIAQKDLGLALQMARDHGIAMPVTGLVTQLIARVYGVYDDKLR